jgi:type I restriction enzyme S subunit
MGHILKGGGFNYYGTKSWISKDKCTNLNKYILHKGDLLMAMTDMKGNISLLGNTALMDVDNEYIVNQRVGLLRSNHNYETSYPYLYLLTNEFNFLEYLRGRSNSGVQVNLTSQAIKDALIVVAPASINKKFNNIVNPVFEKIFYNQSLIRKLNELKQLYLKKFFN